MLPCSRSRAARCSRCSTSRRPRREPVWALNRCWRYDALNRNSKARSPMEQSDPDSIISRILRRRASCSAGFSKRPSAAETARRTELLIEDGCPERVSVTNRSLGAAEEMPLYYIDTYIMSITLALLAPLQWRRSAPVHVRMRKRDIRLSPRNQVNLAAASMLQGKVAVLNNACRNALGCVCANE